MCIACLTDTTCDYCQPKSPANCLFCTSGYYLRRNGITCKLCSLAQTGCALCLSASMCTFASDGYYLQVRSSGSYTGNVRACKASCSTCSDSNTCITCANNYNKIGTTCVYYQNINTKITLAPASGSSSWFNSQNSD
jgi:proprotein convertase subtilisin/kexin type 5